MRDKLIKKYEGIFDSICGEILEIDVGSDVIIAVEDGVTEMFERLSKPDENDFRTQEEADQVEFFFPKTTQEELIAELCDAANRAVLAAIKEFKQRWAVEVSANEPTL